MTWCCVHPKIGRTGFCVGWLPSRWRHLRPQWSREGNMRFLGLGPLEVRWWRER